MNPERTAILLERALWIIMREFGYCRTDALKWLEDDTAHTPEADPVAIDHGPDAFMQVKRVSVIEWPTEPGFRSGRCKRCGQPTKEYSPGNFSVQCESCNHTDGIKRRDRMRRAKGQTP